MSEFHIGIGGSTELRRSVLESLRSVVKSLQQHKQFLEYRQEREREVLIFRKLLREIGNLNNKLTAEMPRTQVAPPHIPKGVPRGTGPKKDDISKEGADRLTRISQLDRLAKKLVSIESELKKIG